MDDNARIACCLICTLAPVMRACPVCAFRIGLVFRALQEPKAQPSPNLPALREAYIKQVQLVCRGVS